MKTLILSDVHLDVSEAGTPRRDGFIRFLRSQDTATLGRLIILGDLFDFWFEYRHVIFSGHFDVLRALADLRDAGVELHLVCGNHDFWAGRFLEDTLDMAVHRAGVELPFGSRRAFLIHGDGINPKDRLYRLYKGFARNPFVVSGFRLLHPDWAMGLARAVSHGSRAMTRAEDVSIGPEALALKHFAVDKIEKGEADVVMCGHAHFPVFETIPTPNGPGLYINTGDWISHRTVAVWEEDCFSLWRSGEDALLVEQIAGEEARQDSQGKTDDAQPNQAPLAAE